MRLKSLEIQGYKSFANKSVFHFDRGVTAIVGPNGSGKSNVADAIRWVLGEQSYSTLRGQRTADMIFAGSKSRPRVGMASATLVLDNSDGSLPLDYTEVTIARRAYRSGENEYLINNNRVRLKDVAEILARGGLARQTYTVIGQGTIDRALSLRAEDRRQLFEEAAGITYHRQQRATALRRLDETHANLLRVHDIVQEIEPRLRRLQKQARRVEEHRQLQSHLDELLKIWYGYRWGQQQQALHQAKARHTFSQQRLDEARRHLRQIEARIQTLRARQTELRAQLGDWHAQSSQLHAQAEALQRELAVGEERARQLAAQRQEYLTEIQTLQATLQQQQEGVDRARHTLTEFDRHYRQAQTALDEARRQLTAHQQQRAALRKRQEQAEAEARHAAHALTDQRARLAQLAERLTELQNQRQEQIAAIEQAAARQAEVETRLHQIRRRLAELETARQTLTAQADDLRQQQNRLQQQAAALAARQAEKEKELASLRARQDLLGKLRADMSGYHRGVKEVLQAKSLPGIRGTVAALLQVPAELEIAIETALGGRLQDIVVNTWRDAEAAIAHLKTRRAGRATFLPL
ncbi:MAG: chromosome segregation protein SMC, partial [Caldilineae bacterium]